MAIYKFYEDKYNTVKTSFTLEKEYESEFLHITTDGKITVKGKPDRNYAWNGCTPMYQFMGLSFGTPDGTTNIETKKPHAYYASMFHDVLYQNKECGLSRLDADRLFYVLLKESGFPLAKIYYLAVRAVGWIFGTWSKK